jgi:hypothetical protein
MTLAAFAEKHSRPPKAVINEVNGNVRATDATIAALVTELGGSPGRVGRAALAAPSRAPCSPRPSRPSPRLTHDVARRAARPGRHGRTAAHAARRQIATPNAETCPVTPDRPPPRPARPPQAAHLRRAAPPAQRAALLAIVAGATRRDSYTVAELRARRCDPFRATPRVIAAAVRLGTPPEVAAATLAAAQSAVVGAIGAAVAPTPVLRRAA